MKKKILIFLGLVIIGLVIWGLVFYRNNLRGVGPVFRTPEENISEIINKPDTPLKLPEGFEISVFAENLGGLPRVITLSPGGELIVSLTDQGKVIYLPDINSDGV